MADYDLAVIGGGPAGATAAALAARRGARVLLLERRALGADKVCGEFLAPEALPTLLGLAPEVVAAGLPIGEGRLHVGSRELRLVLEPPALAVPRTVLDRALLEAASRAGARCLAQADVQSVEGAGPFQVHTAAGGFAARAIIDASGRWSRWNRRRSEWLGLKATVQEPGARAGVDLYFFEGGYCGAQPVGADLLDVAAAVRSDRATRLEAVFALHPALAERSRGWRPAGGRMATSPLAFGRGEPVAGNMLKVGDAAGFIDPFLGQGIATSILTASAAVETLAPFLEGACSLEAAVQAWRRRHRQMTARVFRLAWLARQALGAPERTRRALAAGLAALGPGTLGWTRAFAAVSA